MKTIKRRLTLTHGDRTFLDRWGLVWDRLGGFYLHHIAGADPGIDVHDHPWSFVSIILRGSYTEEYAFDTRRPHETTTRTWRRWSIHRIRLHSAHRITKAEPGTWTLVLRGPSVRVWGFYLLLGGWHSAHEWQPWTTYDYVTRRANTVISNVRAEEMDHG